MFEELHHFKLVTRTTLSKWDLSFFTPPWKTPPGFNVAEPPGESLCVLSECQQGSVSMSEDVLSLLRGALAAEGVSERELKSLDRVKTNPDVV